MEFYLLIVTERFAVERFEVFYDGECPLCRREIEMLRRKDKRSQIVFTDFSSDEFDYDRVGLDYTTLMSQIHGRDKDGNMVTGVEVFRRLYTALGLGWLVAPSRWFPISLFLDAAYRVFAKSRLLLTGRRNHFAACSSGHCSSLTEQSKPTLNSVSTQEVTVQ